MPNHLQLTPLLADADAIIAVIVALITIVGWIANLVSNKSHKGPPVANRPRPPVRPRDDRLQQEINIFIEEAGPRRSRPAQPGPAASPARRVAGPQRQAPPRPRPAPVTPEGKPPRRMRPGDEIATRHAPVTETLGTGVKQHLSQHMPERVTQEVQQRLTSRVEQKVEQDLGTPVTAGPAARAMPAPPAPSPPDRASRFAELMRNPASLQQAIVVNLILSRPASAARFHRR